MWLFGCGLGLAWLRQSQTCSHLLCRGAALRVLPHLRLCRSHAADSITDNTGRIRPEPVRTKRTEYVRAVFYVGLGESFTSHCHYALDQSFQATRPGLLSL